MAISAPTELVHTHPATSGASLAAPSATYVSGRLYLAFFGGSGTTLRTNTSVASDAPVTGTWTELTAGDSSWNDGTNWNVSCFTSTDASGTGTITVTYSGSWGTSRFAHIFEISSGFDTSGMIVQSVSNNQAPTATQATIALADSAASGNMRLGYFVHRIQETLTAANGGTLVGQQSTATPANNKALWYLDSDTTSDPSVTWATNTRGAGYTGFELKATVAAASTPHHLMLLGCGR